MVNNPKGFPKYTQILEDKTNDSASLHKMIDKLRLKTANLTTKVLVVLDACIATEENLKLILEKGCDYNYVSRSKIKDYSIKNGEVLHRKKKHKTKRKLVCIGFKNRSAHIS